MPAKPATGDGPGAFCSDVVAALSHLTQVINQRLQSEPCGGEQGFTMQLGAEDLIFGDMPQGSPTPPTARGLANCSSDAGGLFGGLPAYPREGGPARGK
jgi:hypothetical protein